MHGGMRVLAPLGLGLCLAGPAPAQQIPQPAGHEPGMGRPAEFTSLLADAGLVGRFVMDIAFGPDEAVWVASANGLYRCDGYTWRRFSRADGLPGDFVRSVCVTREGTVWVGTDRGLAVGREGGWAAAPGAIAGPNVRRIIEDADGTIWVCCDTWLRPDVPAGISALREGRWTTWSQDDGLPAEGAFDLFRASDGRIFATTATGLALFAERCWEQVGLAGAGRDTRVWSVVESGAGLMATTTSGLYREMAGVWRLTNCAFRGASEAKSLVRLGDEILGIRESNGLRLARLGELELESIGAPFAGDGYVEVVRPAPDGSVWIGGYNLLVRWVPGGREWQRCADSPVGMELDSSGRVWLLGADGSFVQEPDGWRSEPLVRGRAAFDLHDRVWSWQAGELTLADGGVPWRFDGSHTGCASISDVVVDPHAARRAWLVGTSPHGARRVAHSTGRGAGGSRWRRRDTRCATSASIRRGASCS
jgi:hypothetical protein